MAAPTRYPDWATVDETAPSGAANKVNVPSQLRDSGLKPGQPLARPYFNDNMNLIGAWIRHLEEEINSIVVTPSAAIISQIYPVGAYWITQGGQEPGAQLGFGTWTRVSGYLAGYLDGDSDFGIVGSTLGSKTHTHSHSLFTAAAGAHRHDVSRDGWGKYQDPDGQLPVPTVSGRLVVGTGKDDKGEDNQELGLAANDGVTEERGAHTHSINGGISSASSLPPSTVVEIWRRTS